MLHGFSYGSPIGKIFIESDGSGLTGARFAEPDMSRDGMGSDDPVIGEAVRWFDLYFCGEKPDFMPELHLSGTEFQLEVWKILLGIPYGSTVSYGEIARRIACGRGTGRMSAQAVGGAVGRNPVAVIVPCHRVIGSDGGLTGYDAGLERKRFLLELEWGSAGKD